MQQRDLFDESPVPGVPADVCRMFESIALDVRSRGFDHYSARAILHRMRWHMRIERGNREFKCNNNWTAGMARWLMAKRPELAGFFETREREDEE